MNEIGIDAIRFYTPSYVLDLNDLARAREKSANYFLDKWGQEKMSVISPDEDIISIAANASKKLLEGINKKDIAFLLFATESAFDYSKSAGMYLHQILDMPTSCRIIELKQACYSATAAIRLIQPFLIQNPEKKVLLIASDIAKYKLNSVAESSGGAGAIAMILSSNPNILEINDDGGVYASNQMDFWRPDYMKEPIINGRLSCNLYIKFLIKTFEAFCKKSKLDFDDIEYFCYHLSIPRLAQNAHEYLYKTIHGNHIPDNLINKNLSASLQYGKLMGNSYTASLYLSIISLLDNAKDLSNKRIGLYSYGSGSIGEFFTAKIRENYQKHLTIDRNKELLNNRENISIKQYESWHRYQYPEDGSRLILPKFQKDGYRLIKIKDHIRYYDYN